MPQLVPLKNPPIEKAEHIPSTRRLAPLTRRVLLTAASMREDGFLVTGEETFTTSSYAITTESMEFHIGQGAEWVPEALPARGPHR